MWTRARLAELCHLSEEQVVEWALLMGNDYTRGLLSGHLGAARRFGGRSAEKVGCLPIDCYGQGEKRAGVVTSRLLLFCFFACLRGQKKRRKL